MLTAYAAAFLMFSFGTPGLRRSVVEAGLKLWIRDYLAWACFFKVSFWLYYFSFSFFWIIIRLVLIKERLKS